MNITFSLSQYDHTMTQEMFCNLMLLRVESKVCEDAVYDKVILPK